MKLEQVNNLMIARVVRFSETKYDRDGVFINFEHDELRPIILVDGLAVDVFNHRIYDIVYMENGVIPMEDLATLDRESLYAYTVHNAEFPLENVEDLKKKTEETMEWYYRECKNQNDGGDRKVVSFEFEKRNLKEKKKNRKYTRKS